MTLGLDISTSCIGISIFSDDEKLMSLNYIKLKGDTLFEKVDEFINFMEENEFDKFLIKNIAVEEPLKVFKGKFSNADTIQKLTAMNYMVSFWCYKNYNIHPRHYNVQTIRKTAFPDLKLPKKELNKKHKVWEQVMKLEPQINWIYSSRTHKLTNENYDMADSYAVGKMDIVAKKKLSE
jgi:hypothetical protein